MRRRALERRLDQVAPRGYATSQGANHPGLFGVAAPVPPAPRWGTGTFSQRVGPDARWTEEAALRQAGALRECCVRVSVLLPTL